MYVHGAVAGPAGEFVAVLDRGHAADWVVLPWWWQVRSVADVAVVILLLGDVLWRRVHGDVHDQHGDVVHDVHCCRWLTRGEVWMPLGEVAARDYSYSATHHRSLLGELNTVGVFVTALSGAGY